MRCSPALGADQLVLKAGDEAARAERDLAILAAGARDLLLADPALDIDDDDVAALRRALDRLRFPLLLGDPLDRPVDILLRHLDDEPLDVEIGKARARGFRAGPRATSCIRDRRPR